MHTKNFVPLSNVEPTLYLDDINFKASTKLRRVNMILPYAMLRKVLPQPGIFCGSVITFIGNHLPSAKLRDRAIVSPNNRLYRGQSVANEKIDRVSHFFCLRIIMYSYEIFKCIPTRNVPLTVPHNGTMERRKVFSDHIARGLCIRMYQIFDNRIPFIEIAIPSGLTRQPGRPRKTGCPQV